MDNIDFKPTKTLIRERQRALIEHKKLTAETLVALTDLIDNEGYSISPWVRTCLRGIRQNVRTLTSTPSE